FHVGFFHLLQELAGIGREGFHVAALPLSIDGVEGQGRFARAGDASDDDELVPGDLHVDALEVMLARAFDDDGVLCHGAPESDAWWRRRPRTQVPNISDNRIAEG